MKRRFTFALFALIISLFAVALRAADEEPGIRPDPRPTDLTSKRRGTNDEPRTRADPRALDLTKPKIEIGRSTIEVGGLTSEQSEKIRAIRQKADEEVKGIRDRERSEVMAVLNEQQRADYLRLEDEQKADHARRTTAAPTTAPAAP